MNRIRRILASLAGAVAIGLLPGPVVRAQEPPSASPMSVEAEKLDYDRNTEQVIYSGNVRIRNGDLELSADTITLDRKTSIVKAVGRVRLKRADMDWAGDELEYNLATREMKTGRFASSFSPYHVWAQSGRKDTGSVYTLRGATFSTCTNEPGHLHYRVRSRSIDVSPNDYLKARHSVLFAGPVPIFYTPWLYRSLEGDAIGVNLQPGYQSRMGGYLLSGFSYGLTEQLDAETRVDYRSERGFAAGQEFEWKTDRSRASVLGYLAQDTGVDNANNDYPVDRVPDESRYRARIRQYWNGENGWSTMGELNTFSDEFVLEDFFRREYRRNPDPLNYALLSRISDNQAMSLLAKGRMDDFYSTLSRLPEARHEVFTTAISDSGYYYEGYNDAVWLMRQYASYENPDDVSLLRLDSRQFVSYPMSAGIVHLVPRAGARATWYSKTRELSATDRLVPFTNRLENGTVEVTNGLVRTVTEEEAGSQFRPFLELGSEASFKAFRSWAAGPDDAQVLYRHIVEPYVNYTFRPNLTGSEPEDYYPLDDVDKFGSEHSVLLGIRNMIQFKQDSIIHEWFDADIYGTYYMESQQEEKGMGDLHLKVESRPADAVSMRVDAVYDTQDSELDQWNIRGEFTPLDLWKLTGEYRYKRDRDSLAAGKVRYAPVPTWAFDVYARYNLDASRMEEHAYEIERMLDCMGIRVGFSHEPAYTMEDGQQRDANYNVYLELWLTAFPKMHWGDSRW